MLRFPDTASFIQYLRLQRRGSPDPILVVEGVTDKRAMLPFVDPEVTVIPADGKDKLIAAFEELDAAARRNVAFILDCDGSTPQRLKGHLELAITNNRDVEADLVFELMALDRVCYEWLGHVYPKGSDVQRSAKELLLLAAFLTGLLGAVRVAAVSLGLPVKVRDRGRNRKRPLRPSDLDDLAPMVHLGEAVSVEAMVSSMSRTLFWSEADAERVIEEVRGRSDKRCSSHDAQGCQPCRSRTFSRGHDLVDVLPVLFKERHGVVVTSAELDRGLRVAVDTADALCWPVVTRLQRWERVRGVQLLKSASTGGSS